MMFIFFVYIKNTACLLFTVMRRERRWFVLKEGERLKLEGETENMGVCTKERKGVTAEVLMATSCTKSLGGESVGYKHEVT